MGTRCIFPGWYLPTTTTLLQLATHHQQDTSSVFVQNMCYPQDPLQPGLLYFLVERKVHLFGICCEAIPRQVNYLIDEAHCIGKGANTVISLVHHYLVHHSLGEQHLHLHADNCVGQNKNNYLIRVSLRVIIIMLIIIFSSTVHGSSCVASMTPSHCPS